MKITNVEVKIKNLNNQEKKDKGVASILIDNCFAVKNIVIVQLEDKVILSMPSIKFEEEYCNVAYPINKETRKMFEEKILSKFSEEIRKELHKYINIPGYFLGIDDKDIYTIDLIEEETRRIVKVYNIEDYASETLEELQQEMLGDVEI